jgi:hypothetical protein
MQGAAFHIMFREAFAGIRTTDFWSIGKSCQAFITRDITTPSGWTDTSVDVDACYN